MNEVDNLLNIDFLSLSYKKQLRIKELGPHQPRNFELQQMDKLQVRTFSSMWFHKIEWLTVSITKKTFYCFYCLLFGGGNIPWCQNGFTDLKHLSERSRKHENSVVHINNAVKYKTFGLHEINQNPIIEDPVFLARHNEMAKKNRNFLNHIINCIMFCGCNNLAIVNHDDFDSIFPNFVSFMSILDFQVDFDMDRKIGKKVVDQLLECMYHVYKEQLIKDIGDSLVSVQVSETSTVSSSQFLIILRFVKDNKRMQRFLTCLELTEEQATATSLMEIIETELNSLNIDYEKVIAQTYNTSATIEKPCGIQHLLKEKYQYAEFVHYYGHDFNNTFKHIFSKFDCIKTFFANVYGFVEFFSKPPNKQLLQNEFTGEEVNWKNEDVFCLHANKEKLFECLQKMVKNPLTDEVSTEAAELMTLLGDSDFLNLLGLFYNILQRVDDLYKTLAEKDSKSSAHIKAFAKFKEEVSTLFERKVVKDDEDYENERPLKRLKKSLEVDSAMKDVCEIVVTFIKELFTSTQYVQAFSLVDPGKFDDYKHNFPDELLNKLTHRNDFFDSGRLRIELAILYATEVFGGAKNVEELLYLISCYEVGDTFVEVSKLLKTTLITPSSEEERTSEDICFEIQKFLNRTSSQGNMNSLIILKTHADVLKNMSGFKKLVIDQYVSKYHKEDYAFK